MPRPVNRPVECWQPIFSASPRGIDFMVKHGIKGVVPSGGTRSSDCGDVGESPYCVPGATPSSERNLPSSCRYTSPIPKRKRSGKPRFGLRSNSRCWRRWGGCRKLSREQILATYDPKTAPSAGLPTVHDLVRDRAWICGPPEHVYEKPLRDSGGVPRSGACMPSAPAHLQFRRAQSGGTFRGSAKRFCRSSKQQQMLPLEPKFVRRKE